MQLIDPSKTLYRWFAIRFPYEKLLFIHKKITWKNIIPRSALLPCRQPLVSHVLHWGNRFSLKFEIFPPHLELLGFDDIASLTHVFLDAKYFRPFRPKSTSRRNPLNRREDFDSCKDKSQLMLTTLNEAGEITS